MNYGLYVITDEALSKGLSHAEITRRAILGGADTIQLRDKRLSSKELLECAIEIRDMTRSAGVSFIVNDRLDIALASGADGVHLGQDDMPLHYARNLSPPGFIIGISAGTVEEAKTAVDGGADYIGLGPICQTSSKGDAGPVCGFDLIARVKAVVDVPVVAIGGLGSQNIENAIDAGADGIAVISAVVSQDDIEGAARALKGLIDKRKVYQGRRH
jgi:thiamine-phosphate pyrophosphorylase